MKNIEIERQEIIQQIEKQKNNLLAYQSAVYGDTDSKKMCLSSIAAIKELLFMIADKAKKLGFEDLSIKANFLATTAVSLYKKYYNDVYENVEVVYVNGFATEDIEK